MSVSRNNRGARKVAADDMVPRRALAWGGAVILAITIYVAFSVTAFNGLPWKNYRTVYATVPATGNLIKHDQVRIAGVRVGQLPRQRDHRRRARAPQAPARAGHRSPVRQPGLHPGQRTSRCAVHPARPRHEPADARRR
jgi:hypothetical protein